MSFFPENLETLAETVLAEARKKGLKLAASESCTGGLIAACLTEIAGSSDVFDRGFVTYSNNAKKDHLGVAEKTLAETGAVSEETAHEMAVGTLRASLADIAVSVTGIAGPGGGSADKPVGLVYIGISLRKSGETHTIKNIFKGDRSAIRLQTVEIALAAVLEEIKKV